jgi:cyclase
MLAKRVIPCLDVDAGRVVKGTRFQDLRDAGDPVELAAHYDREGADELVFLDITATVEGRQATLDVISQTAEQVFIPLTVGGGVRDEEGVNALLRAGADKVSLNSAAVRDPTMLSRCADRFGTQCMVVAIDARRRNEGWEVVIDAGRTPSIATRSSGRGRRQSARRGRGLDHLDGPGRDRRGIRPGCSRPSHRRCACRSWRAVGRATSALRRRARPGGADAVLAASRLHFGQLTIRQVKEHLAERHLPVRL